MFRTSAIVFTKVSVYVLLKQTFYRKVIRGAYFCSKHLVISKATTENCVKENDLIVLCFLKRKLNTFFLVCCGIHFLDSSRSKNSGSTILHKMYLLLSVN